MNQSQEASMTVNMPMQAYGASKTSDEGENNEQHDSKMANYNVQMQAQPASKLSGNDGVTDFRINNEDVSISSQPQPQRVGKVHVSDSLRAAGNKTGTPKASLDSPNKMFDHKQDTFNGTQQPVQNVFQVNLSVNNNPQGQIMVSSDNRPSSGRRSIKQSQNSVFQQHNSTGGKHTKSKDRRPMSSKHINQGWQNASYGPQANMNPYLGISKKHVVKKRPQSANRKTIVRGALKQQPQHPHAASFMSPGQTTFKGGKHSFSVHHPNSLPSQKQMILIPAQAHGGSGNQGPMFVNELSASDHSAAGHQPVISASNINNYNRSMKFQSQNAQQMNNTTKELQKALSANKVHKQHPTSIFGSPDKPHRVLKSKIPTVTLQSREDLYEQNMQTKMKINSLQNENRKINTKMMVLENQLQQKDKLFEDMYKAAFQQVRLPPGVGASQANLAAFTPSAHSLGTPHHNAQNLAFYPPSQMTSGSSLHASYKPVNTTAVPYSTTSGGSSQMMSTQQHAQAQQLINSYKRTIREQSKEIEKRDGEVEKIKRSVKMTQINQVLVENETYRVECQRLREQLERVMMVSQAQHQQQSNHIEQLTSSQQRQLHATEVTIERSVHGESAMDTFKRDRASPGLSESLGAREAEQTAINNQLRAENQDLSHKLNELMQAHHSQQAQKGNDETATKAETEHLKQELRKYKHMSESVKLDGEKMLAGAQKTYENKMNELVNNHKIEISELKKGHEAEVGRLENKVATMERESTIEKEDKVDADIFENLEVQLEIKTQELKEITKEVDILRGQQSKSAKEQMKLEMSSKKATAMMAQRMEMYSESQQQNMELEEQNKQLKGKLEENDAKLQKFVSAGEDKKIKKLEQQISFSKNAAEAQKYEMDQKLQEQEEQIEALKLRAAAAESQVNNQYQSPPVAPNRRRSSVKSKKNNVQGSLMGDSSFDHASESQVASARGGKDDDRDDDDYSEDRSDLGFSTQGDIEAELADDKPLKQATVIEAPKEKELPKISVNEKTIFGLEGMISPKEHPGIKEGFVRLRHACQVNFIRHDSIEDFLFGKDYRMDAKFSIQKIKEAAMSQLNMQEDYAQIWARYVIQQGEGDLNSTLDLTKASQGYKVIMFCTSEIREELVYFRAEKDEKMKLIIGEKLQQAQNRKKLTSVIQQHLKKQTGTDAEQLTVDALKVVYEQAGLSFNKETIQCCFIYLLKQNPEKDLLRIRKSDLLGFIQQASGKAHDLSMTGSRFPLETELVYSSDSDGVGDEVPQDKDFQTEQSKKDATLKSAGAVHDAKSPLGLGVGRQKSLDAAMKPTPVKEEDSYSDDDDDDEFGANDSRSDGSATIPEEVVSESPYLAVKQSSNYGTVDDSINDRDLESSVARTAMPPLPQVPEVRQSRETTIENSNAEAKKVPEKVEEPTGALEQNDGGFGRSLTLQTPLNEHEGEVAREAQSPEVKLHHANTLQEMNVLSNKSMNSSQGSIYSSGSKKRRHMVKIDISTVNKGNTVGHRQSGEFKNLLLKDTTHENSRTINAAQQNTGSDQKGDQVKNPDNMELSPLKSEKLSPVRGPSFTVHECDPEEASPYVDSVLLPEKKKGKGAPPGILVAHVPESSHESPTPNTGRTGSSVELVPLVPAKAEKLAPPGISVAHEPETPNIGNHESSVETIIEEEKKQEVVKSSVTPPIPEVTNTLDKESDSQFSCHSYGEEDENAKKEEVDYANMDHKQGKELIQSIMAKEKVTETTNIKIEHLQTEESEDGFELPNVIKERVEPPMRSMGAAAIGLFPATKQSQLPSLGGYSSGLGGGLGGGIGGRGLGGGLGGGIGGGLGGGLGGGISGGGMTRLSDLPSLKPTAAKEEEQDTSLSVPPSASKLLDDSSFGQGVSPIGSAEKSKQVLPPLELDALKPDKLKPEGIQVGALMTEEASSFMPSKQITLAQEAKDSEDENYSDDDYSEEPEHSSLQPSSPEKTVAKAPKKTVELSANQSEIEEDYEF